MFPKWLVATDGSDPSVRAADVATSMSARWEAAVTLLTVVAVRQSLLEVAGLGHIVDDYVDNAGRQGLAPTPASCERACVRPDTRIEVGSAAEVIIAEAQAVGADLVDMGRRGAGELAGLLLGSVSSRVARHLAIPVVLVP